MPEPARRAAMKDDAMTPAEAQDSQILNYVVRMVIPMRREFAHELDVHQFLHDLTYARHVIRQALHSQDPRLQEYARYIEKRLRSPRIADTPGAEPEKLGEKAVDAPADKPGSTRASRPAPLEPAGDKAAASAEELRARIMRKYTDGLR